VSLKLWLFLPPLRRPGESCWVIPSPLLSSSQVLFSHKPSFSSLYPLALSGLLMFAVAHILYAAAFGMRPLALRTGLVIGVLSGLCYALLYPGLSGAFTYLVGVYVALISFMGWRAMAGLRLVGAAWRWTELAAGGGALLFILSDLTIALNKFCFPVPYSRALIMSTYYAAQMLIALSAVESREPVGEDYRLSKAD
jgi:uncharacterized membrane protein YhhN